MVVEIPQGVAHSRMDIDGSALSCDVTLQIHGPADEGGIPRDASELGFD